MSIDELPLELMSMIAWQIDGDDFESFAMSSKKLYDGSRPRFSEHRSCKRFRILEVGRRSRSRSYDYITATVTMPNCLDAFERLIDYPVCARYVQSLRVNERGSIYENRHFEDLQLPDLHKNMESLVADLSDSKESQIWAQRLDDIAAEIDAVETHAAESSAWKLDVDDLELTEQTIMVLLPYLCPNLKRLRRSIHFETELDELSHTLSNSIDVKSLNNLEEAYLEFLYNDDDDPAPRDYAWLLLEHYLRVPTIRQIHLDWICPTGTVLRCWSQDGADICSNLEALFARGSNIPSSHLEALLRCTPRLEQLSYEHDVHAGDAGDLQYIDQEKPLTFFEQITASIGTTIRKLSLLSDPEDFGEPQLRGWKYPLGHLHDMRQLECLQEFTTKILWLLSPEHDSLGNISSPAFGRLLGRDVPLRCNLLAPRLPQSLKMLALAQCRGGSYRVQYDADWRLMHQCVLTELFGAPIQPIACILPNLTSIQLEEAREPFPTKLRHSLHGSDCVVSTEIDTRFPSW